MVGSSITLAQSSDYKSAWDGQDPADFGIDLALLTGKFGSISAKHAKALAATGGAADAKASTESTLESCAFTLTRALAVHFKKSGDLDRRGKVNFSKTDLVKLRDRCRPVKPEPPTVASPPSASPPSARPSPPSRTSTARAARSSTAAPSSEKSKSTPPPSSTTSAISTTSSSSSPIPSPAVVSSKPGNEPASSSMPATAPAKNKRPPPGLSPRPPHETYHHHSSFRHHRWPRHAPDVVINI